jgi:Tfp pilus assembly protein PilX
MTRQALDDTQHLLIDLTLLVTLAFFGAASYDSLDLRERFAAERSKLQIALYHAKDELRFTQTFMLNCLNRRVQVVGGPKGVGVECIIL